MRIYMHEDVILAVYYFINKLISIIMVKKISWNNDQECATFWADSWFYSEND